MSVHKKRASYKSMEKDINDIFIKIRNITFSSNFLARNSILLKEEDYPYFSSGNTKSMYLLFKVRQALFTLDESDRVFIINEFYYRNKDWWLPLYSRSSFYRKKKHAMMMFLKYYNICL